MYIKIKNYKNIKDLNIEFSENKINFLYGLSGTGKSSIVSSLTDPTPKNNVTFGVSSNDELINVTPKIDIGDIAKFNNQNKYLFLNSSNNDEVYRVVFTNGDDITKINEILMSYFSNFLLLLPTLNEYLSDITDLKKELGMRKNGGSLDKTINNISRLEKEVESYNYKANYNFVKKHGLDYLKWVSDGTNFSEYQNSKCPFCNRKLNDNKINKINKVLELTPDNYKVIVSSNAYMKIFKIEEPNYTSKRNIARVKRSLQSVLDTEKEVINLISLFTSFNTKNLDVSSLKKINLSDELKLRLPNLEEAVNNYNDNLINIKKTAGKLNGYTKNLVSKNIDKLNMYLRLFSIPYKFKIDSFDRRDKKASVILIHNNLDIDIDNRMSLSYGETNLIAILLFIFSVQEKYIIIDDPASSFDENKRLIIYNLIMDKLKDKTVILLSHDPSFIKYAFVDIISNNKIRKREIGKTYYVSKENDYTKVSNISSDDFKPIFNHVIDYIKTNDMSYYQLIINIRILVEILDRKRNKKYKLIYGYLSSILHNKTKEEIYDLIKKNNTSETKILRLIKNEFNISLPKLPDNRYDDFDYNCLSVFEKVFYKRESIDKRNAKYKELNKYSKDLLSNIVHLNDEYLITLNPYKYSVYPSNILDILEDNDI